MVIVKLAEDELKAPTRRDIQEFEARRDPDRDGAAGALTGAGLIGVPSALLIGGVNSAIKGEKGSFAKGFKRSLPVTVAAGALMGLSRGAAGNPRYAHPVDYFSDSNYRRKSRNVYNSAKTERLVKYLRRYDDERRKYL